MVYQQLVPSEGLRPYICDYTLLCCSFDPTKERPVKPFPAHTNDSLVFYLRGCLQACNPATGSVQLFPAIAINSVQVSRLDFYISANYYMIAVNFHAGVLGRLLRLDLAPFVDARVDGEAVLGTGVRRLYEQMINAPTFAAAVAMLEQYLWAYIQKRPLTFEPIDGVTRQLASEPSAASIRQRAAAACLSMSQFERRFYQHYGLLPGQFARISRFHQAYSLKEQHPRWGWLRIALETGYHDYQHLAKDFKQFAGSTPNSLLAALALAPERMLLANGKGLDKEC